MTIETIRDQNLLIFEAITGSRLYGTKTETSDTDIIGVFVLPNSHILSGKMTEVVHVKEDNIDAYYFELRKFLKLLSQASTQAIETLFMPDDFLIHKNEIFDELVKERSKFITGSCKYSFGYSPYQITKELKLLNSLHVTQEPLDFYKVLPDQRTPTLHSFNSFNSSIHAQADKIKPHLVMLYPIEGLENVYSLYYCYKLHYLENHEIPIATKPFGMELDENDNPRVCTKEDLERAQEADYTFRIRTTVFFDKKNYLIYKRLKERKDKLKIIGYNTKKLAHCYRLMNFGLDLAEKGNIDFKTSLITKEILNNEWSASNLEVIFGNLKTRIEHAYSNITNTLDQEWLKSMEVTLRSRAELLRTMNKEQVLEIVD